MSALSIASTKGKIISTRTRCIDCGACEPECPVTAIFPEEDVPAAQQEYVQINRDVFKSETPPGKPTRK